jgi:hypothetical protein
VDLSSYHWNLERGTLAALPGTPRTTLANAGDRAKQHRPYSNLVFKSVNAQITIGQRARSINLRATCVNTSCHSVTKITVGIEIGLLKNFKGQKRIKGE